jgi:hypothetical protein
MLLLVLLFGFHRLVNHAADDVRYGTILSLRAAPNVLLLVRLQARDKLATKHLNLSKNLTLNKSDLVASTQCGANANRRIR